MSPPRIVQHTCQCGQELVMVMGQAGRPRAIVLGLLAQAAAPTMGRYPLMTFDVSKQPVFSSHDILRYIRILSLWVCGLASAHMLHDWATMVDDSCAKVKNVLRCTQKERQPTQPKTSEANNFSEY